ncbi:g3833 [Coccomyxa elongata]
MAFPAPPDLSWRPSMIRQCSDSGHKVVHHPGEQLEEKVPMV